MVAAGNIRRYVGCARYRVAGDINGCTRVRCCATGEVIKRCVRDQRELPMTPDSLFAIGSTKKAFTTTLLGTMVDEGLVEWDAPLRNYLPEFRLSDPMATQLITPRDLVTHRSGLPRHDLLWYNNHG